MDTCEPPGRVIWVVVCLTKRPYVSAFCAFNIGVWFMRTLHEASLQGLATVYAFNVGSAQTRVVTYSS